MSELGSVYDPQRQLVKQQQEAIDPAMQAQEAGLMAAKTDAFQSINEGANRRGLFYSGVPLAEQAKYTGSTFLPAVANLRSKYQQQRFNLQDALNQIQKEQSSQAYGIRQKELDTEEQRRQFDAQLAAQRSAAGGGGGGFSPSFGGGAGGGAGASYRATPKQGGGFAFTDADGQPISAATYAAATGIPFRNLLQNMANQGDQGAKSALNFVGGDYGYDPNKISQGNNAAIYNALVWGTNLPQANAPRAAQGRPQFVQPARGLTIRGMR
jgi:hypothetical protein